MPDTDKQFELRQLLKAYRKGLISDEIFEDQMREIQLGTSPSAAPEPPPPPARTYRVRDKTYSSERDMVISFVDEFRAGEAFGGVIFSLWTEVAKDPAVRGGLRAVCEREAMHGRVLAARLNELGAQPRANLPESFREQARARLGSQDVSDADKVSDFLKQIPDAEAAVAPIREVLGQIEDDLETCALLAAILEDELATIRWFHQIGEDLGVSTNDASTAPEASAP
ncbi:MAG: hypothetical protein P8R42_25835 [Candidatus Binatia bacterium]|nr:hypothetical protein [Candidatus Binatia bacterium]